jgi:hypothetical protein
MPYSMNPLELVRSLTLDNLDKLVKILAIIIGGIGAYYKFFKGRIFVLRLEPKVSGSVVCKDGVSYLQVTAAVKNIGLSKVDILHEPSGLRVTSYQGLPNMTGAELAVWSGATIFDVFKGDPCIEAGETVEEQYLVVVPGCEQEHRAFQLELRIVYKSSWQTKSFYWLANGIVNWESEPLESKSPKPKEAHQ